MNILRMQDKIRGMFYGIAIGDALGAPVETFTHHKINDLHGFVDHYIEPTGHKWFDGRLPGFITDDTQLSLAVAKALITAKDFNMDEIAKEHVKALKNPAGWGGTTRRAIQRIDKGIHWSRSGIEEQTGTAAGAGNGVPMKIGPVSAWYCSLREAHPSNIHIAEFGAMTHYTDMGVTSGFIHFDALNYCFTVNHPCSFSDKYFCDDLIASFGTIQEAMEQFEPKLRYLEDNLVKPIRDLKRITEHQTNKDKYMIWSDHTIREVFGNGSCYVYTSLPFSYAFFLRNPHSFQSVLDVVNAGGDTDTNGSLVGSLLGALNGPSVFPQELIAGLQCREELDATIDKFNEIFLGET